MAERRLTQTAQARRVKTVLQALRRGSQFPRDQCRGEAGLSQKAADSDTRPDTASAAIGTEDCHHQPVPARPALPETITFQRNAAGHIIRVNVLFISPGVPGKYTATTNVTIYPPDHPTVRGFVEAFDR